MVNDSKSSNSSINQDNKSQHIIDDINFQKLLNIKNEVYEATEVRPTIHKLVNLIIEHANLENIRDKLIKQYQ